MPVRVIVVSSVCFYGRNVARAAGLGQRIFNRTIKSDLGASQNDYTADTAPCWCQRRDASSNKIAPAAAQHTTGSHPSSAA
jgi:hypothetical protein